jgi:carbon storage regulator
MLVLSRKTTQQIHIGETIVITVLKVRGKAVQIGIDAPREMKVLRSELPVERLVLEPVGH